MKRLLDYLDQTGAFRKFDAFLSLKKGTLCVSETTEEAPLLLVLEAYKKAGKPLVVILPNLYKAQMFYDHMSNAAKADDVCFFPQDEFITSEMLVSSNEFKIERLNTIKKILANEARIVITHLAGAIKPCMPFTSWKNAVISLKSQSEQDQENLVSLLVSYGYVREFTVEKPGDFSVRGGIVDVFPINETFPVRLDFFGDFLEQIKVFDTETQRSGMKLDSIEILPMYEFFYDESKSEEMVRSLESKLKKDISGEKAKVKLLADIEAIKTHTELDRLIRYLPIVTGTRSTMLDLFEDALVFFVDYYRIRETYEHMVSEIGDWYLSHEDYVKVGFPILYGLDELNAKNAIYIDYLRHGYQESLDQEIVVAGQTPMKYEGNFDLFLQDVASYVGKTTVVIAIRALGIRENLLEMLDKRSFRYVLLGEADAIVAKAVNVVVSSAYFDLHLETGNIVVLTDQAISRKQAAPKRGRYVSVYRGSKRLTSVNDLKPGDYVVHMDYGIGKFLDITTMTLGNVKNDYIHIEYRDEDKLYLPLDAITQIQRYAGSEGFVPRLNKLGGNDWLKTKERVREKAKDIADKLINLYAEREHAPGFAFQPDSVLQQDFEADFEYEETPDQLKAVNDVKRDMEAPRPMDRLLCGDVGFGKTEVAMRAAFKAVLSGKQVAYLAPTTVLAKQHFHTFKHRMDKYGVNVGLLNRFVPRKDQKIVLQGLLAGTVDILIGTHRILSKDIIFKDLGLLVIDEEQRFGVEHKEKIKEMKVSVDVLSLSATPIPRTLQMAIMGVKNMSLLETAPENRYPIQTYVLERNDAILKDAIERELARKGQVFYIYNRVDDIETIAAKLHKLVPEANFRIAHGQMSKFELENVVDDFIDKRIDVLIATTIVETGIDIPNANTLIIHDADKLGLSQLYQIRGRVGRSDRIAYAYLMYQKEKTITEDAEKRLKVIKEFTELGSGFKIAIRDLSIRGAGDILGSEQSGFIDSVGIDLYLRILQEEIKTRQGEGEIQKPIAKVRATVSKYIERTYIDDDFVKMEMHGKINAVKSADEIKGLSEEFADRFGEFLPDLEIYMYEKLFESLSASVDIEKLIEAKTNVTAIISEEGTRRLAGDELFKKGMATSKYIRFAYKHEKIHVILDTIRLEKHWLYTMCEFLDAVVNQKKSA